MLSSAPPRALIVWCFLKGCLAVSLGFPPSCWHPLCVLRCVLRPWPSHHDRYMAARFQGWENVLFRKSCKAGGCGRPCKYITLRVCTFICSQLRSAKCFWILSNDTTIFASNMTHHLENSGGEGTCVSLAPHALHSSLMFLQPSCCHLLRFKNFPQPLLLG